MMPVTGKKMTQAELAQLLIGRELRLYEIQNIKDVGTVANLLDSKKHKSFQRLYLVSVIV